MDPLVQEIQRLQNENFQLKKKNDDLREDVHKLRNEMQVLLWENEKLKGRVINLEMEE